LSFCHKLKCSNLYFCGTLRIRLFNLKKFIVYYTLGCEDIGIRKSEFVSKTQFFNRKQYGSYIFYVEIDNLKYVQDFMCGQMLNISFGYLL